MEPGSDPTSRREGAERALDAYADRRRRRRAGDTYFGSAECLLSSVESGCTERDHVHRRRDLLQQADDDGMPTELAALTYDLARDAGIDPALGYELVRTGLGVVPPEDGVSNAPSQPATDKYVPTWLFDAVPTDDLLRERMLRLSFLRLRGLLERHERVEDALDAFAREPDVALMGY